MTVMMTLATHEHNFSKSDLRYASLRFDLNAHLIMLQRPIEMVLILSAQKHGSLNCLDLVVLPTIQMKTRT